MERSILDGLESDSREIDQYVSFRLHNEEYALDIKHIQEVIRTPRITSVPQMPHFVLGVVNIRGKIVPVFDLRLKFGLVHKEIDNQCKLLVAKIDTALVSFLIDEILENVKLEKGVIDPAPDVSKNIPKECIDGLAVMGERMIAVLNIQKLGRDINECIREKGGIYGRVDTEQTR